MNKDYLQRLLYLIASEELPFGAIERIVYEIENGNLYIPFTPNKYIMD